MACIRKRRGKWVIDYRDASGKRRWETTEGNRKDAEERMAKIVSKGRPVDTKQTFQEYAKRWLETYRVNLKAGSFIQMESVLRIHLFPAFGSVPFSKVDREMVKQLIAEKIKSGLSRSTVSNIIVPLREMYNHAIDDGVFSLNNPASRVGRFNKRRDEDKKINPFTREELSAVMEAAKEKMPHYYPLLLCAARTGIREGELIGLKGSDIDFHGRFIDVQRSIFRRKVTTTKNHKSRRVDMSRQLTDVLDKLIHKRKADALRQEMERPHEERRGHAEVLNEVLDGWLFITPSGSQLESANLRDRMFYRLLDMAGLRRVRFHDLRHTFATLLLQQGESLVYVKDQLGHSSIQITVDTYGHLVPGGNKQAVDKLDDVGTDRRPDIGERGSNLVADGQVNQLSH
ncbi:MAG: site-specific integrase [Deltaproteobacteria bacterium]|nr:site-specific integrase [Deltaproteobacteria bacterium]